MVDPWEATEEPEQLVINNATTSLVPIEGSIRERIIKTLCQFPSAPIPMILSRARCTEEEYYRESEGQDFIQSLVDHAIQTHVLPAVPSVLISLTSGAVLGNDQKLKTLLQLLKVLDPDSTSVNISLKNESEDGLRNRLANLQERLLRLKDGSKVIDVEGIPDDKHRGTLEPGSQGDVGVGTDIQDSPNSGGDVDVQT